jgi:hypothetical protein
MNKQQELEFDIFELKDTLSKIISQLSENSYDAYGDRVAFEGGDTLLTKDVWEKANKLIK